MNQLLLLKNISKHIELTRPEEEYFLSQIKTITIKRKQFLLRENEICLYSSFVSKGCLRAYNIDENGFEHILQFAPPDWWIADMYSLITQKPGSLSIDAVEDSEVQLLSRENQEKLFLEIPKFERFFRILTEKSLVANRQRVLDNLSLTAAQRYHLFCEQYPTMIECLPQKMIASYIGVTPEFLSKLRSEYLKNGARFK